MAKKSRSSLRKDAVELFWQAIPPIWHIIQSQLDKNARGGLMRSRAGISMSCAGSIAALPLSASWPMPAISAARWSAEKSIAWWKRVWFHVEKSHQKTAASPSWS